MLNFTGALTNGHLNSNEIVRSQSARFVAFRGTNWCFATIVFLCALIGQNSTSFSQEADSLQDVHFTLKVLPVLKAKCFACHGDNPNDLKGELDLTSFSSAVSGGESGEASLIKGNSKDSLLMNAVRWEDLEMPPKENDRLTDAQIEDMAKWIDSGAVWPSEETQARIKKKAWESGEVTGVRVATSGGTSKEWTNRAYKPEDVWAFRPVEKPTQPSANGYSIDAFIERKQSLAEIEPAKIAEPGELIRRASFDLMGLPPTLEEIREFEKSYLQDPDSAWVQLIDRLLASPQYGERWAQHWLDVVRYADTAGFSNDFERSNAWRYRDYVVRSLNEDKPYNQFVIEQIAGDELLEEQSKRELERTVEGFQVNPSDAMIATGVLRMGPWEHTAMTPEKVSRQNYLDDTVNGIGEAFLSTALRCCKCHDHKFDPLPTRDYYRMYAALATTQPAELKAPFLEVENRNQFVEQKKHVQELLDYAKQRQDALYAQREEAAKAWYKENGGEYVPHKTRTKASFKKPKPPRFVGLSSEEQGILKVREQDVRIWTRRLERFEPLAQSVYNGGELVMNSQKLRRPFFKKQKEKSRVMPVSYILEGGDIHSTGDKVFPGVLSAVGIGTGVELDHNESESDPYLLSQDFSNRRLGLARWIANERNGLATRSIVNRVWHYHFGKGLAGNPNNFGATGAKPTHPELLDWLVTEFIASGWSLKSLHRTIMLSKTYRRSTDHSDFVGLQTKDPKNETLAIFRPRRLTAEEYRDATLLATGELNLEVGGLPIRPEMNWEVALSPRMIQFSLAPAYQPERTPEQRNRRSIYIYRIRGLPDPMMEVLDKPNPDNSCEIRDSASTTPQVFALLNGDVMVKRSIALALRAEERTRKRTENVTTVEAPGGTENDLEFVRERIRMAYELAMGTGPEEELLGELVLHYQSVLLFHQKSAPEKTEYPTKLTRSLVEEFSGDAFEYEELLNAYQDYVPDKEPADVSPETRALADICLLLFNSNEFMYVY